MLEALLANQALTITLTGALVGIAGSLVGTFLLLRGSAMLSDAMSHSIVFGIVVVWLLTRAQSGPVQIIGAALTGVLTVVLTELLTRTRRVKNDAAIGLVFPALFAAGVLLLNLYARDVHIDTHTVLLGEIGFVWLDTLSLGGYEVPQALLWMGVITLVNAAFVGGLYKELKLATFDPQLAAALGFAPTALFYALLLLTSATAVAAFDAVGAVLFIAFAIVPPATAYLLTDRLWLMLLLGALVAIAASVGGYAAAVQLDVSIGGTMALMTGACLALAFLLGPRHGLAAQAWRHWRQRYANEARALAIYLYEREDRGVPTAEAELAAVLEDELGWPTAQAAAVLERSRRSGLIRRDGSGVHLTPKGRETARALRQPWRRREADPAA